MTKQSRDEQSQDVLPSLESAGSDGGRVPSPSPTASRPEVHVDDSAAMVCYANFCRVTGTPEELILDFGLNAQPMGGATNVEIKQRLIVNYFTAKRLLQALGMSIQRHENAFGVLETDVQKRVTPAARRAAAPG
jgi:Protein of unknown function (DUF3467)